MKILFPYMARWNSANMSRYYHLFTRIADAGHEVIVLQPPERVSEETNYIDLPMEGHPNVILQTVPMIPWLWNTRFPLDKFFKKAIYTLGSYFQLRRTVAARHPDIVVLYNLPQYIYTLGCSTHLVFDVADDYLAMFQHELGISERHSLSRIARWILKELVNRSMLVTVVSKPLLNQITHPHVFLLPNGASVSESRDEISALHIDRSKPVIGYVGAFEYFIDLDLMASIADKRRDCTFLYVGAGREFVRFKDIIANLRLSNVILTGAVPHRQAMKFIEEMDVCLNLFRKGPVADAASPIKLFEYLSRGKPVISTHLEETDRLDANVGCLFYADDLPELDANISRILAEPERTGEKVNRGLAMVKEEFTWDVLARRFLDAVQQRLDQQGAHPRA